MELPIYVFNLYMYVYNREGGRVINSDRHRQRDRKKYTHIYTDYFNI